MALSVLTDVSGTSNTRTLSWTIPTLAVGDVVVVTAVTWDQPNTQNIPSGSGLTFTQRVGANASTRCYVYIWTAVAASAGTSIVVTSSQLAGGTSVHNGALYLCPTADGYSLAATPNTVSNATITGGSAPQSTLTGVLGSLGVYALGDWNATDGATRAYVPVSSTEDFYQFTTTLSSQYGAHCTLTGASTTVGMSAPLTGSLYTLGAIEVLLPLTAAQGTQNQYIDMFAMA